MLRFWNQVLYALQGEMHHSRLVVPRLKVHKDWWQGLAEDFIAHDNPDVGGKTDAEVAAVLAQQAQAHYLTGGRSCPNCILPQKGRLSHCTQLRSVSTST